MRISRSHASRRLMALGLSVMAAGSVVLLGAGDSAARARGSFSDSFTHPRANPYFPLTPGLVLRYRGTDGPDRFQEQVVVTNQTKMIEGVRATVVRDVLRRTDGSIAELTHDWYANDNKGNVWYLGEATATYRRNGQLESREGSWEAGVKGARAGQIMPASPRPTDAYRQEYWRGHAEDQAWIVQNQANITVPNGTYHHVVRSYEWSRLEKANVSVKFYARGLGIVAEHDVAGGSENFKLVGVTRP